MNTIPKETCFVCGHKTLQDRCDWEICPVCGWEDDVLVLNDEDRKSSANKGMRVSEAQVNFILYGTSLLVRKDQLRAPFENEIVDPDWRPLTIVAELLKQSKIGGKRSS